MHMGILETPTDSQDTEYLKDLLFKEAGIVPQKYWLCTSFRVHS